MVVLTPGKKGKKSAAAEPRAAATGGPPPTRYKCAVCGKPRSLMDAGGRPTFLRAPNGGKNCLSCVAIKEKEGFAAGRMTLDVELKLGQWWGYTASRKMNFQLVRDLGATDAMVLGKPRIIDREGKTWTGRLYQNGQIHFLRTKAGATTAGASRPKKATKGSRSAGRGGKPNKAGTPPLLPYSMPQPL